MCVCVAPTKRMARAVAPAPPSENGSVLIVLFMMAIILALGTMGSVSLYVEATLNPQAAKYNKKRVTLMAGWANVANALTHLILVILLLSSKQRLIEAGIEDAEDISGPVFLLLINGAVGWRTLSGAGPIVAFGWNVFVAITGTLVPLVWPRFVNTGLAEWPYPLVFMWLLIFVFESMAFFSSAVWLALKKY